MADKRIYDLTEATEAGTNDMLALDNSNFAETKKIKASNFVKLLANKYDVTTVIQTGSTNTTGGTITKGTFFYLNGDLCVAIADIASGATFTFETNYTYAEIGQEIASVKSDLSKIIKSVEYNIENTSDPQDFNYPSGFNNTNSIFIGAVCTTQYGSVVDSSYNDGIYFGNLMFFGNSFRFTAKTPGNVVKIEFVFAKLS